MLNTLPSPKTNKGKVQAGRGYSSGHGGHASGRGTKGQKSRSGYSRPRRAFEGGQMPLSRRLPKLKGFSRGFATKNVKHYTLKLSEVAANIESNQVNIETLAAVGLIKNFSKKLSVKIVFDQNIDKALQIEGIPTSKTAQQAIEQAGGSVL
jgi:large subunit ribosomal protein L15